MYTVKAVVCAVAIVLAAALLQAQGTVAGVFFSEGWESGSVGSTFNSRYYGNASSTQYRLQSSVKAAGLWALEHVLRAGMQPGDIAYSTQHFGDARSGPVYAVGSGQHFYDLYVQYKVYYSPNFDISNVPKQLIIGTEDDRRHDNSCCNPWVAHYLTIYPAFGANWLAEANNKQGASGQWVGLRQNASGYSPTNVFRMQLGRWYTVEVRRRLNDSGDNGIFQLWIDGVLISDHRDIRYRVPWNGTFGANYEYGTNFVMISDYMTSSVTRDESIYYDDVRMSTTYMGTGSTAPPPSAPTNVRIVY